VKALRKTTLIVSLFLVGIVIVASVYGIYSAYLAAPSSPSTTPTPTSTGTTSTTPTESPVATATQKPTTKPTNAPATNPTVTPTPAPTSVTVTDGRGESVTIPLPVERIVSLDAGFTEMLCLMGAQNLIVGRTTAAITPPSILSVTTVGDSGYASNIEAILELQPDLIMCGTDLTVNPVAYQQLSDTGIPIFIADTAPQAVYPSQMTPEELYNSPTVIDHICGLMQNMTAFIGHEDEAEEFIDWAQSYNKLVKDRVAALAPDQYVKVFVDWYASPYRTFLDLWAYQAGGINIAENQTVYSPRLNPEFILEQNPDAIIELISSPTHNVNDFIAARNDILSRSELQGVSAVQTERVYVCDFYARRGVRCVVGYLYWATWLQPSLFADINPAAVNQELNQKFFGTSIAGTFAYP
jgi:iron complex transport system substrate-binding protein